MRGRLCVWGGRSTCAVPILKNTSPLATCLPPSLPVHVGQPRRLIALPSFHLCSSLSSPPSLSLSLSPPFFSCRNEREEEQRQELAAACPCPCSCCLARLLHRPARTRRRRRKKLCFLPRVFILFQSWSIVIREAAGTVQLSHRERERERRGSCVLFSSVERVWCSSNPCMDGKELFSPSDHLQPFYAQHPSPLAGMPSVIRPMPNMNMSPTAILQSIGGGSLGGVQFEMDAAPPPLLHNSMGSVSGSASGTVPAASPTGPVKRKRGRPRKYGPDGTMKVSAAAQQQQQQMVSAPPRMGSMSGADMVGRSGLDDSAQKKRRGRPPGTGKKPQPSSPLGNAFSGLAGTSFTPHIITASPSEDVAGKIVGFAKQSSRAVCVLSAMGSVSRAILRHPADASSMSRLHTSAPYKNPDIYEGLYEILSLSGSYNLNEGAQNQSDRLSVTLCSPERHVIGGVLGGALVAASTVQVVLGSFLHGGSRSKSKKAGKQPTFSSGSLTGGQDASPSSGHNQNLTPPSVTGGWPSSGIFDTTSSNIDINSSRG